MWEVIRLLNRINIVQEFLYNFLKSFKFKDFFGLQL